MHKIAWIGVAAALIVGATVKMVSDMVDLANQGSRAYPAGLPAKGCSIVLLSEFRHANDSNDYIQSWRLACDRVDPSAAFANATFGGLAIGFSIPVWPAWSHEWMDTASDVECSRALHGDAFLLVATINQTQTEGASWDYDSQKIELVLPVDKLGPHSNLVAVRNKFWTPIKSVVENPLCEPGMTAELVDVLCHQTELALYQKEIAKVRASTYRLVCLDPGSLCLPASWSPALAPAGRPRDPTEVQGRREPREGRQTKGSFALR